MAVKTCKVCLSQEIKKALLKVIQDQKTIDLINQTPECPDGQSVEFCLKPPQGKGAYQLFISKCLEKKNIKGSGAAPGAMKECALEWQKQKQ